MSGNQIGNAGAAAIADALPECGKVDYLQYVRILVV
jgi:hypothetical protein